jgi:hypothetical protein
LLLSFEKIVTASEDEKEALFNLVIVGGGPTGVELAGAFAEMRATILPKDYPKVNFSKMRIIIVEGSGHTLNSMSDNAKTKSEFYLKQMKVEIIKGAHVTAYDGTIVSLDNGETLKAANVIWSAGVKGNTIPGLETASLVRNRYVTDRFNRIQGLGKEPVGKHQKQGLERIRIQGFRIHGHHWKTQSRGRFTEIQIQRLFRLVDLDVLAPDAHSFYPQQIGHFLQLGVELHNE